MPISRPSGPLLPALGLLPSLLASGCAVPEAVGSSVESVVYGTDDRVEVYQAPAALQTLAQSSIVALIPKPNLVGGPSAYTPTGGTLDDFADLCPGQRFADQPASGNCSGTLIDDDLVLTAGHCVETLGDCQGQYFVFDYFYTANGQLASIGADDVYECRAVVAWALTPSSQTAPPNLDYAIVQLDRPVVGRTPATIKASDVSLAVNTPITVLGFGSGLPLKVDDGGVVTHPGTALRDFFVGSPDTFGGNSGSGVFDASGELVGILVRGATDYVPQGNCAVVNVVPDEADGAEAMTYVHRAIDALCRGDFPSTRLCDIAPSCGDGFCTGAEDAGSCAADCTGAICGDRACAPSEQGSCIADCGAAVVCGDGFCELGEPGVCAADCPPPACGNGLCEAAAGETGATCAADCATPPPPRPRKNGRCSASVPGNGEAPPALPLAILLTAVVLRRARRVRP